MRVVASEWLKLVTVRSTFWTSAVALVIAALTVLLVGLNQQPLGRADGTIALVDSTVSLSLVALVVGVLGVLSIGGEYATLQIRSSYTAVPRRWPALVAKAAVVGAWSFVLGLVLVFGGLGLLALLFGGRGIELTVTGGTVGGAIGGALYLAVVGVVGVGLGALVRSSAAGITILAALLFVAPIVLGLLGSLLNAEWATNVGHFLLSAAGGDLSAAPGAASLALWAAWLTLLAWVAAVWAPALVTTLRRDV